MVSASTRALLQEIPSKMGGTRRPQPSRVIAAVRRRSQHHIGLFQLDKGLFDMGEGQRWDCRRLLKTTASAPWSSSRCKNACIRWPRSPSS